MTEFKSKRQCIRKQIPHQEPPPFLILESTRLERSWVFDDMDVGEKTLEHWVFEGDNQREVTTFGGAAHHRYLLPFYSIVMDNERLLNFVFTDKKKCDDFNKNLYTPWPLTTK